jgi:hypothetical protein
MQAAENITSGMEKITLQSQDVSKSMTHSTNKCSEIKNIVEEFKERLSVTNRSNLQSTNQVGDANDRLFMGLAKLDHIIWKVNTYLSILTKKEQFKYVDHHNCRLGKWYYGGEGKQNFSRTASYNQLETPHSTVHNGTQKIFDLIADENFSLDSVIEAVGEMEQGSAGVFDTLDKILAEK